MGYTRAVRRFSGDEWNAGWRIAVVANDAIGNFVVSTPLLQLLRSKRPASITYFGGARTAELEGASDLFEAHYPLHGTSLRRAWEDASGQPFDLVINLERTAHAKAFTALLGGECWVCGPCLGPDGRGDLPFAGDARGALWADRDWTASDLTRRFPFLESGFIGELFCRLCGLDGALPPYRAPIEDPGGEVPDVLVSCSASLPEKLWRADAWTSVLGAVAATGRSVGLLGAPPKAQGGSWKDDGVEDRLVQAGLVRDLRGAFTLPQVVGALRRAKAVLTLDNGILHLAAATDTPTVGLFRDRIHRLWAPPCGDVRVVVPSPGAAVSDLEPGHVLEVLLDAL